MEFISFLKQSVRLTPDMEAAVNEGIKRESYSKHHKLLLPGHQSKMIFFIETGLARMYYLKEGSKDITHLFFDENTFIMPADSVFFNHSSPYGVEILEPSVICSFAYSDREIVVEQYNALNRFIRFYAR